MPTRLDQGPASSLVVTRHFTDLAQGRAMAAWYRNVEPLDIPGVAAMADADPGGEWVRIHFVAGPTLRLAAPDGSEAAKIAASVCRIVAELHRAGVSHGAITPDHLIVSPDGVVLIAPRAGADPADDREALASLADWFAARDAPSPRFGRTAPVVDWPIVSQILRATGEGGLQRAINRLDTVQESPRAARRASPGRYRAWRWLAGALCFLFAGFLIAGFLIAGFLFAGFLSASLGFDRLLVTTSTEAGSQLFTVGSSTYAVAETNSGTSNSDGNEQIAVVPRPCAGQPGVVLFDPDTTTVWIFAAVGAADQIGQRLATVPGATDVTFNRTEDDCASVLVVGPAGAVELEL